MYAFVSIPGPHTFSSSASGIPKKSFGTLFKKTLNSVQVVCVSLLCISTLVPLTSDLAFDDKRSKHFLTPSYDSFIIQVTLWTEAPGQLRSS